MSYDKTTYAQKPKVFGGAENEVSVPINNISELFGSGIASRMEGELGKYPGYEIEIRKKNGEGSIILEKRTCNGNHNKPLKIERVIYPIIKTQCGFDIPEACIRREEYKNGKLTIIRN